MTVIVGHERVLSPGAIGSGQATECRREVTVVETLLPCQDTFTEEDSESRVVTWATVSLFLSPLVFACERRTVRRGVKTAVTLIWATAFQGRRQPHTVDWRGLVMAHAGGTAAKFGSALDCFWFVQFWSVGLSQVSRAH